MNPGAYIWWIVFDKYKSFIAEPKIDLKSALDLDYPALIENILVSWKILLKIIWSTWDLKAIVQNPAEYYYDWETEFFIESFKIEKDWEFWNQKEIKYYLYVETFKNSILSWQLYEINKWNFQYWKKVNKDIIPSIASREILEIQWLKRLVVELDIEYSLIKKLKSIIYSIDRKIAEAEKHFNNYTEEFKVFRNIEIPENCYKKVNVWTKEINVVDWQALWKIVESTTDTEGTIEIIKNWNDLLEQALKFMETQFKIVSNISDIPAFFFSVQQETWNDSWTSKIKSSWAFYQRVIFYRKQIENAIYYFLKDTQATEQQTFDWPAIVKLDETEVLANEVLKITNWLTTRKKSIMLVYWYDEQQAQVLIDEIIKEQSQFPINTNNNSQVWSK